MAQYRTNVQQLVGERNNPTTINLTTVMTSDASTQLDGNGAVQVNTGGLYHFGFTVADIKASGMVDHLATGLMQVTPSGGATNTVSWTRTYNQLNASLELTTVTNAGIKNFNAGDIVTIVNYVEPLPSGNAVLTVKPETIMFMELL